MDGYALLDVGDGARLERFGDHIVERPHRSAEGRRRAPARWNEADLRFDREVGWSGTGLDAARAGWTTQLDGLAFQLRPTDAGGVGLFPEHVAMLPWLRDRIDECPATATVLNLFGYTGLITLALARAGTAVAHVDAARSAVSWARRNAALNDLADRPIRWLIDDARAFVAREVRRDRRYDGVVLDPPTYGHAMSGPAWRLATDLDALLVDVRRLLAPGGFIVLTAHTEAVDPTGLGASLGRDAETGELALTAMSGAMLRLGAFARMRRAS